MHQLYYDYRCPASKHIVLPSNDWSLTMAFTLEKLNIKIKNITIIRDLYLFIYSHLIKYMFLDVIITNLKYVRIA